MYQRVVPTESQVGTCAVINTFVYLLKGSLLLPPDSPDRFTSCLHAFMPLCVATRVDLSRVSRNSRLDLS
jgi:hypothetical protein